MVWDGCDESNDLKQLGAKRGGNLIETSEVIHVVEQIKTNKAARED